MKKRPFPVTETDASSAAPLPWTLRPAQKHERWLIWRRILREGLDPTAVKWQRFTVAAAPDGSVLGFAQVKPLAGGVREFGSLVVEPHVRGRGVGAALVKHFLACTEPPVYLMCGLHNISYYRRFGFRIVEPADLPPALYRKWRIGSFFARLVHSRVAVMVYTPPKG
ncbi:MAG: N-acetyltransferase [Caldilineae bacterium]|nr:MAG: N-acetyltransferase [Caldilineae bacterium]